MSSPLLRNTQASAILSRRKWLLHRCIHLSGQSLSTSETTPLVDSKKKSVRRASKPRQLENAFRSEEKDLPENLVSLHLSQMEENPLADIESQRPAVIPSSLSQDYEEKYRKVVVGLDKAFSAKQMRDFLQKNNIPLPHSKQIKHGLASQILEKKWGWETLEGVLQRKIDWSRVVEESFPLDKAEAFLFMGKDGTGALHLSRRYESQVNFIPDPMSVKVTGLQGFVKKIGDYLQNFKEGIEIEYFTFPFNGNIKVDTSVISRLSGAYVKMTNDSEVSISFLRSLPSAAESAKRLILQATTKGTPQCTRAIYLPNIHDASQYSLFPFSSGLPASVTPQKHPTTTFRYRRVGQNFMNSSAHNSPKDEADFGYALTADNSQFDIKDHLVNQMPVYNDPDSSLTITASSGNVLFISPPSPQKTLFSPIDGQVDRAAIFHLIDGKPSQVTFHPNTSLEISTAPTHRVQNIRRLIYRTVDTGAVGDSNLDHRASWKTIELEIPLPNEISTSQPQENVSCVRTTERFLDLLIPERQGDIRINSLHKQPIPLDTLPEEFKNMELFSTHRLHNTEDSIPLLFKLDEDAYFLHRDDHVQRSFKTIPQNLNAMDCDVIVETSVERVTGTKETTCKTVCQDYNSASGWNDFVKTWSLLATRSTKTMDPLRPSTYF